jgi:hypothetical protein
MEFFNVEMIVGKSHELPRGLALPVKEVEEKLKKNMRLSIFLF